MQINNTMTKSELFSFLKQFVKFGLVGISNTIISLVIYYILVYLNVHYIIANALGFAISVVNAYYWNSKYVFLDRSKQQHSKSFIKSFLSYFSTFLLGTALLFLMVNYFGISDKIAPIINLFITIPINFLLNKLWAFR